MAKIAMLKPLVRTMQPTLACVPTQKTRDMRRDVEQPLRHLYKTYRWQKLREQILQRDMYICQMSGVLLREGRSDKSTTGARPAVIDHLVPHRGDLTLFWDTDNLWAISSDMHDTVCQAIEARRGLTGADVRRDKLTYRADRSQALPSLLSSRWMDQRWPD